MAGWLIAKVLVALAPAPILLLLFARLDVFKLISLTTVAGLMAIGAALAGAAFWLNGGALHGLPIGFTEYSRFVAPPLEEALKCFPIMCLFALNRIGFKLDAAIVGFAVGAGFAVAENLWFLSQFADLDLGVWTVRGFGTAIMHGGASALFAAISHEFTERQAQGRAHHYSFNPLLYLPGFIVAVAVHSAFNQFPTEPLMAMLGAMLLIPLTIFVVFYMGERSSHDWLERDGDTHRAVLEALRTGTFADTPQGIALHTIAERLHNRRVEDAYEYARLHTELVLRAEELLLAQKAGEPDAPDAGDRAKFERLHALEKRLGKAALSAIRRQLHFSRNDLWELERLEQATTD